MDLHGFNLNLLVVFDAIMSEGSVTRASARLGVSQPAVSNSLRELRRVMGDPLFVRQGRGIAPTPRAEALAAEAAPALAQIRAALLQGPFDPRTATLEVRLETADYTELVILPQLETRLAREAPGVSIVVLQASSMAHPDAFESLLTGRCDLCINRILEEPDRLRSEHLLEGGFVCVVRRDHPEIGDEIDLDTFLAARHLRVAPDESYDGPVEAYLADAGLSRFIAMTLPRFCAAPPIIAETDLIAILPARLARRLGALTRLRILPCPLALPSFSVHMLWAERTHESPAFRWFRGLVRSICSEL